MIGRVVLAALVAGIVAGLFMGVIQHVRLTPMILEAENYEGGAVGHHHGNSGATAEPEEQTGQMRTAKTFAMTGVTGAGFAAVLAGFCVLTGIRLRPRSGLVAGLCAFVTFSVAPAAGLPPELPGMPTADLGARQLWWAATVICTAGAFWLTFLRQEKWAAIAAVVLALAPHAWGAPQVNGAASEVPAELVAHFVANSLAANCVFWIIIGLMLGIFMPAIDKEIET